MKKFIYTVLLMLISIVGQSQLAEKVAERYYNQLAYVKAVEYFEELANKDNPKKDHVKKTALCYMEIGDLKKAEFWYTQLVANYEVTTEELIQYAYLLKSNKKYDASNNVFHMVFKRNKQNSVAVAHLENKNYHRDLRRDAKRINLKVMGFNTSYDDFSPVTVKHKDSLGSELLFCSNRKASPFTNSLSNYDNTYFLDLYKVVSADSSKKVNLLKSAKTKFHDGPVCFSNGGTVMYLTRNNYINGKKQKDSKGNVNLKLFIASKQGESWSELEEFKYNSDQFSCGHASVTEDGKTMYFISDMPETKGETDIFKTTLTDTGWSKPTQVPGVNTSEKEMFPFITEKGVLFFSSYGRVGLGGLDIYRAYPVDTGFLIINVGYPINTNFDDFGLVINTDESRGYFSSNRSVMQDSSYGGDDIYGFTTNYPFGPNFDLRGRVTDQLTAHLIPNTWIKVINKKTGKIADSTFSKTGKFEVLNLLPGEYRVIAEKPRYSLTKDFEFNSKRAVKNQVNKAHLKMKREIFNIEYRVSDGVTGSPIADVNVKIKNNYTGQEYELLTNRAGYLVDSLTREMLKDSNVNFSIVFSKEGYFNKELEINQKYQDYGTIKKNVVMIPIQEIDVKEICKINEIFYDLGKWNIRPDAALELDKLVKCMKENPGMTIEIGSHTDCRGSKGFNQTLSEKRGKSCRNYVISQGIDPSRIYGKGYGESKLVNDCQCEGKVKSDCSEQEHQENRRTTFRVIVN